MNIKCPICNIDLLKFKEIHPHLVFMNGYLKYICNNCYNKHFNEKIRRCSKCSSKVYFPYLHNYKLYCSACYNKMYKKEFEL